jgi:hypothetical protein
MPKTRTIILQSSSKMRTLVEMISSMTSSAGRLMMTTRKIMTKMISSHTRKHPEQLMVIPGRHNRRTTMMILRLPKFLPTTDPMTDDRKEPLQQPPHPVNESPKTQKTRTKMIS